MKKLMTPEEATSVLADVGLGEHIAAFRLNGRSRAAVPLFDLASLAAYLTHDDVCVDPNGLVEWIRDAVGDEALADAVALSNAAEPSNYERVRAAARLIAARVGEAQGLLE